MISFNAQTNAISNEKIAFKATTKAFSATTSAVNQSRNSDSSSATNNYVAPVSTSLRSSEEQTKYNTVSKMLDFRKRSTLNALLKNGTLLSSNSNDKSTVLDNLYKIATEPRIQGLEQKNILKETITSIANPYTITQNFGDIPTRIATQLANGETTPKITEEALNVRSSSCVATSIEFNLASKMPAEFTRMVAGLSSEKHSVNKKLKLSDIATNAVDAIWLLNEFKMPHKINNWNDVEVTLHPDRNAIIRARVQNSYKDSWERSSVDVLMQSTLMNIGSQNTYESLTDTRTGKYNPDNKGLTDIEKNFTEEIAEGKAKVSITYQIIDEEGKLTGYICDLETTQKHLLNALQAGNNVIIGYVQTDSNNKVINGHEITLIGAEKDENGKLTFICNDTDDNKSEAIKWSADDLLPRIHHAGLPVDVLKDDVEITDSWREVLEMYKEEKSQTAA